MGKVHPGATLTPHFRDFLPAWLVRQPWYVGTGAPVTRPVGYFRFEDPAGEVGIETHLVENEGVLYQVPLTYRDAPLAGADERALITTAEHSVLGTRYIYDGQADPLYRAQLVRIVDTNDVSDPSLKHGVGPAEARGVRFTPNPFVEDSCSHRAHPCPDFVHPLTARLGCGRALDRNLASRPGQRRDDDRMSRRGRLQR